MDAPLPYLPSRQEKPCSVSRQGHRSAASNQAGLRADPLDNLAPLLRRHPPQAVEKQLIHIASRRAKRVGEAEVRHEGVSAAHVLAAAIELREHRSDGLTRSDLRLAATLFTMNSHTHLLKYP